MVGYSGNNFNQSTLDILAGKSQIDQSVGSDSVYGEAGSSLSGLLPRSGERYDNLGSLASEARASAANANWLKSENFQNAINAKYDSQANQVLKGSAAADIVGSAEVAQQVASRKIDNLAQQKEAYGQLEEAAGNFMKGMALPGPLRHIVGLVAPSFNMGAQLAKTGEAIAKIQNLESQDALADETVLQNAFGQAGYNPLANEIYKPFNEWEKQYVSEQNEQVKNKNSALQTALGAYQAQNHLVDTLAGIHHDEVAERMNVLNKADAQESRKVDYQKDLSANQRAALAARVAAMEDATRNREAALAEQEQNLDIQRYPDKLALQQREQTRKEQATNVDAYNALTERGKLAYKPAELALQERDQAIKLSGQEAQRYVADQQLKGKELDKQVALIKQETKKIGNGGSGGTGGTGQASSVGKQSHSGASNVLSDAIASSATMDSQSRTTNTLANLGLANPEQNNAINTFQTGQAMLSSEDSVEREAGAKLMKESADRLVTANENSIKALPEGQQKIVKAIIQNQSGMLEPKDEPMVNDAIASGDLAASNNPEINWIAQDVTQAVQDKILENLYSQGVDINLTDKELLDKNRKGELITFLEKSSGSKMTADERTARAKAMRDNIIARVIEPHIKENSAKVQNELERELAQNLGSAVNASAGKKVVDTENLPATESITAAAKQMARSGMTNSQIMDSIESLKSPKVINQATEKVLASRYTNTDPVSVAYNYKLKTNEIAYSAGLKWQGIGDKGKAFWNSLLTQLPQELDQFRAEQQRIQAANILMLREEIDRRTNEVMPEVVRQAGQNQSASRPKTAQNTQQTAANGSWAIQPYQVNPYEYLRR